MMLILIPCLVNLLYDGSQQSLISRYQRLIHDHSLERIKKIGPVYPKPFKTVMEKSPALKLKLETALKSAQRTPQTQVSSKGTHAVDSQPKIQLKMNFSNFK